MKIDDVVNRVLEKAGEYSLSHAHAFITPEHILYACCFEERFKQAIKACDGDVALLQMQLEDYLNENMEPIFEFAKDQGPLQSAGFQQALAIASQQVLSSGREEVRLEHIINACLSLPENYISYLLECQGISTPQFLFELCHNGEEASRGTENEADKKREDKSEESATGVSKEEGWRQYVIDLNERAKRQGEKLIGRSDILERTILILARCNKHNPLHLGEPGVGKTAITLGLAQLINKGEVPKTLQNAHLFSLDLGSLLAGTQYRGDFEKRIKFVLEGIKTQENPIVYIDEIHNIVGAGALGHGSLDASNLLKPYLEDNSIRFIGATTFEEYKKYFEKDKALVRRFQTIEVKEPSLEESLAILKGIQKYYEDYHQVIYTEEAVKKCVDLSVKHIHERYLPDKAIDLLDEAGAYRAIHPLKNKVQSVEGTLIEEVLSKICHIPKQTIEKNEQIQLKDLEATLKKLIFNQDQAIHEIVESIKLSRAGLNEPHKPIASFLFVGPTGVGKTQIAKSLSECLGIELVRFDMSEYTEKHTASKLIGSPPGYVGYEEGGLLTESIRKHPYCVLLLDEIEKAHSDIFNILLQVMDYGTLTDNQGRKANFENVILIMTSNAGASQIGKNLVGFGERSVETSIMTEEIKKLFSPEFRNRLSHIIAFNGINLEMATQITEKALNDLKEQLRQRGITLTFSKSCVEHIAKQGLSKEFGAREILRVMNQNIKPLLADKLLFEQPPKEATYKISFQKGSFQIKS